MLESEVIITTQFAVYHHRRGGSGTQHGFCFPERAAYDSPASEETWSKIFAMRDCPLK
jgi:hypothetical protein